MHPIKISSSAVRTGALTLMFMGAGAWASDVKLAWISKPDGGVQCERPGVTVEEMRKELKKSVIDALCGAQAGFVVPASCKGDSGVVNVYAIRERDLSRAESIGFTVFPNDGRYGHPTPICTPAHRP